MRESALAPARALFALDSLSVLNIVFFDILVYRKIRPYDLETAEKIRKLLVYV